MSTYWADLPSRIDAAYRVPELPGVSWGTGNLRFFSGAQYWEYQGTTLKPGFPKRISQLGLPNKLRFHAAVNRRKGKNQNFRRWTFLFSGHKYYVFDEKKRKLVNRQGYDISRLHILGSPHGERIKAAMEGSDDQKTYFFYDDLYYAQDDKSATFFVGNIKDDFFHCCDENNGRVDNGVNVISGNGRCAHTAGDDSSRYTVVILSDFVVFFQFFIGGPQILNCHEKSGHLYC
mgnify:CR=1 FL=1